MTEKAELSIPVLTSAEPKLFVSDTAASCDFFTGKVGFTIDFVYGDPIVLRAGEQK